MKCKKCGKELTPEEEKYACYDQLCTKCFTKSDSGIKEEGEKETWE